jgi:phosphate transport system protein
MFRAGSAEGADVDIDITTRQLAAHPSRAVLDREERVVKDGILRMGSLVEAQIREAVRAVAERDREIAAAVIASDERINDAQREIADTIVTTIATQGPVARDLRFLIGLDHVAFELERIGDHATSIAKQVRFLADESALHHAAGLVSMGQLAADQVRGVVGALIDVDDRAAREVAAKDDDIDHLYRKTFGDLIDLMRTDPQTVEPGTRLILAAHWIERIGDRVTNIAEDIVYLATGQIEDLNP